ncbi:MFS transporter [Collimonas fungivorans]|uniref:Major facilitator superfamily (MFS) transporter n=1 Tax=Collimonas fungivorans (strain Ter331) TaxID=1005048 RepID=G0AA78_COLFT|nr:MFS transporter [Collimonas fungivorans]AEK63012.1 major facilitator superfamily (MFS) transporter [Collimonas fungivorans Ter331]
MSSSAIATTASSNDRRHRWKVLGVGVAANASFSAAFSGIPTTAVLIRSGYHLDNAELGLVLGLMGLGIALSELPWGLLTDRWGDRPVLLSGLATTAVALALMALFVVPGPGHVPGLPLLAAGLLLVGLLGGSVNGSSGRAVMTWFGEGERGMAMSIRQTAVPLGGAIGALFLPALAAHFGFASVYGVLALFCAVTLFFTWLWLYEPAASAAEKTHAARQPTTPAPLKDRQLWRIVAAIGILCAPQCSILFFGAVFLHDFSHAGIAAITIAMATLQCGAMVMRVWSGRWTDRKRNRREFLRFCTISSAIAFAALAALVTLAGQSPNIGPVMATLLIAMLVLTGVSISAWHGVAYTELATIAGARNAGTALGMANTSVFVMCFLTPLAIPHILTFGSWPAVWLLGSACALVALRFFPKPVQAMPASVPCTQ